MFGNSTPVNSNQTGVAAGLQQQLDKYSQRAYLRPIHLTSRAIFDRIDAIRHSLCRPLILDAGCGTGYSTVALAKRYPDHLLIGIDKSRHRLRSHPLTDNLYYQDNLILARADLIDLWRLMVMADWQLHKHFLLYPNPWPKKKQQKRRWYAHPILPMLMQLGGELEVRSNWQLYIYEFARALKHLGQNSVQINTVSPSTPLTPFESKYAASQHPLYRLVCTIKQESG